MRLVPSLQRLMLRTERGPLRGLWAVGYGLATRLAAALLLWRRRGSAYTSGGTGFDRPIYGVSDVDLMVVVETEAQDRGAARRAKQSSGAGDRSRAPSRRLAHW